MDAAADPAAGPMPLLPSGCRATLLGDAAHPMSMFKGQGANQALCDGVQLARAVRRSALCRGRGGKLAPSEAFAAFERQMLRRVCGKVAASREAAIYLHTAAATEVADCTRAAAAKKARAGADAEAEHC